MEKSTENVKSEAVARVLVVLILTMLLGFALGVWFSQSLLNHEQEYFYKGVYSACVAQTRDEVGCLSMQKMVQHRTDEWDWDLWQWPLPEVTPSPTPTTEKLEQNG